MAEWESRITRTGAEAPDQLLANPRNWRIHPSSQQKALAAVLDSVGWVQHVVVNERTGHVVDGHLRVSLAISRGEAEVPVLYVDLSEDEEALVLASLDPLAGMAVTDEAMFSQLTADLTVSDAALAKLLGIGDHSRPADPDEAPELPADPKTKPGDLYVLGEHRLLCGDATDEAVVARALGGERVALVATDPPYGVDYAGVVAGRANQKAGGWRDIANDEESDAGAVLTGGALRAVRDHAGDGCAVLVWHPSGENAYPFRTALEGAGVHILKQIIWVKPTLVFGRHEYHWRHEPAMYGWFEGSRANFYGDRSESTVWEVSPSPGFKVRNGPAFATGGLGLHPTQKPVELSARPIRNHTREGEVVFEPFAGSGSCLIAAEMEGRRCVAIDVDPAYCDAIVARWETFTGNEAKLDG